MPDILNKRRSMIIAAGLVSSALYAGLAVGAAAQTAQPMASAPAKEGSSSIDPARRMNLPTTAQYVAPADIEFHGASFLSEGVRLTSQWFVTKENAAKSLPTIIMAHGWGGTAAGFRQDAVDLARAGYRVMLFDYRGWGDSDGRIVLDAGIAGGIPAASSGNQFETRVKELRGYVDPQEQSEDWFNAISFAVTQHGVDKDRIGLRGSSFSGGYVVYVAANDPRVKVVVSQVGSYDSRPEARHTANPAKDRADADLNASQLTTGEIGYPPDRIRINNLTGASPGNKRMRWMPMENLYRVTQPTLFLMAENEEMFPNSTQGMVACEKVMGPRKAVVVPAIEHHDIYASERVLAVTEAIDWFDKYLKAPGSKTRIPINHAEPERADCHAPFVRPVGVPEPEPVKH